MCGFLPGPLQDVGRHINEYKQYNIFLRKQSLFLGLSFFALLLHISLSQLSKFTQYLITVIF